MGAQVGAQVMCLALLGTAQWLVFLLYRLHDVDNFVSLLNGEKGDGGGVK